MMIWIFGKHRVKDGERCVGNRLKEGLRFRNREAGAEKLGENVSRFVPLGIFQLQIGIAQPYDMEDGRDFDSRVFVEWHNSEW